ncbi:zinc ribbon domain-containing protein [Okeania sp. KiyG1]|uniref:zinc ribbon domain-containing protein n=1 Tax=Okeania sp. KiyG1 TaxID=2720165 RepID=UPI0035C8FBEA
MLEVKTIAVNPRNTSQDCSNCGKKVDKELSQRTHSCPHCGIVIDRDLNAAINIKNGAVGPRRL